VNPLPGELVTRVAARLVVGALLAAMTLQYFALSREDRENFWVTASLCALITDAGALSKPAVGL
jgi:hypothetical protein